MIYFKLENKNCLPHVGSEGAAGMDLRVDAKEQYIEAGKEYVFSTGVRTSIPKGWVGLIFPRSGMGCEYKMRLLNTTGVIDSDYRGLIKVVCTFGKSFWLESYERVCQMVVVPHLDTRFTLTDELDDTLRGDAGFGDSGRT